MEEAGAALEAFADDVAQNAFLFTAGGAVEDGGIVLGLEAEVDEQRRVAAVVDDQVGAVRVGPGERLHRAVPVLAQRLALPGEDGGAGGGDAGGGVVLRREDVAGGPAHPGAQRLERLNEHGRLDGHVEAAGDAGAGERLVGAVLGARGHEAGHFVLRDFDFLAAPVGQRDVLDLAVHVFLLDLSR